MTSKHFADQNIEFQFPETNFGISEGNIRFSGNLRKLQSSLSKYNENITELETEFIKDCKRDENKKGMVPAKYLLECMSIWPTKRTYVSVFLNFAIITSLSLMGFSVVYYIFLHVKSIPDFALVSITTATTFTGLVKTSSLVFKAKVVNEILTLYWKEFWPAAIADENLKKSMAKKLNFIKSYTIFFILTAVVCASQFIMAPIISGNGELPILSAYPFDFKKLPYYELITVWYFFNNYLVVAAYAGFDYLFLTIVISIVLQFQLLEYAIRNIYNKQKSNLLRFFMGTLDLEKAEKGNKSLEMMFLTKCIKHHQMLLQICKKCEDVFSTPIFMVLFLTTLALCVSSLALSIDNEHSEAIKLILYSLAHIVLLFMYCYVGNELIYGSTRLIEAAFYCGFNNKFDREFWKSLIILMRQCKVPQYLTASGITTLNFRSYIGVVRLAFSFYTLLKSFLKKK